MMAQHRRILFSIIIFSVLVGLAGSELALRLLNLPFSAASVPNDSKLAQFDEELGWISIPSHSAVQTVGSDQRRVQMYFDADGARIPTPNQHYDRNVPSVIFVGGSFTMGHGLPYENSFVGQINKMDQFPLQAINFGVDGYGTDQAYLMLKRVMKKYNTKAVVYTFIGDHVTRNDYDDPRLFWPNSGFVGTKPRFDLDSQGKIYQKSRPHKFDGVFELRLWQLLKLSWFVLSPPPSLKVTEALICAMKNYAESEGARFFIVNWRQWGDAPIWRNAQIEVPCVQVIDLGTNVHEEWESWTIPGDGHPNRRAHTLAAKIISKELKKKLSQ